MERCPRCGTCARRPWYLPPLAPGRRRVSLGARGGHVEWPGSTSSASSRTSSRMRMMRERPMSEQPTPDAIEVRGARVRNLKDIDIDIPLGKLVGIAGVSGSGKSSLALSVLYAEGSRRYLGSARRTPTSPSRRPTLHGRTRCCACRRPWRCTSAQRSRRAFDLWYHDELNNSLRLLSRCAHHVCPHCGTRVEPSLDVAAGLPLVCSSCSREFLRAGRRGLGIQQRRCVPDLWRHRYHTRGGRGGLHYR